MSKWARRDAVFEYCAPKQRLLIMRLIQCIGLGCDCVDLPAYVRWSTCVAFCVFMERKRLLHPFLYKFVAMSVELWSLRLLFLVSDLGGEFDTVFSEYSLQSILATPNLHVRTVIKDYFIPMYK